MEKDYSKYFMPDLKQAGRRTKSETEFIYETLEIPVELHEIAKGRKYLVRTFGCQANERDGETLQGILEQIGYERASKVDEADVIILNTCAVRENAEQRVFGEVGNLKRLKQNNKDLIFAICGCMIQEEHVVKKVLDKFHQVDILFGTHNLQNLPELLLKAYNSKETVVEVYSKEGEVVEALPVVRNDTLKAWVNVMYGCDKFCTYCIVPYTRGKERSRKKEDVLEEVRELKEQGYKEITLLGQNVNAYGKDIYTDYDFGDLLIDAAKIGIPRVRFTTSHPWDFNHKMIDAIRDYDNIMPYVHLPLQSGDDTILKRMGRRYSIEEYENLYNEIREKVDGVSITTDIIVGFPGETEEQFQHTLDAMDKFGYDSAFTFIYSPREATPAARMKDDVTMDTKKERFNRLVEIVSKHALARNKAYVGKTVNVLVEGLSKRNKDILSGYSDSNKLVNFKGDKNMIGEIVKVKITKAKSWTLEGEQVD